MDEDGLELQPHDPHAFFDPTGMPKNVNKGYFHERSLTQVITYWSFPE